MITSNSVPPQETVLLKYIYLKMLRKDFQSVKESIFAGLSSTKL